MCSVNVKRTSDLEIYRSNDDTIRITLKWRCFGIMDSWFLFSSADPFYYAKLISIFHDGLLDLLSMCGPFGIMDQWSVFSDPHVWRARRSIEPNHVLFSAESKSVYYSPHWHVDFWHHDRVVHIYPPFPRDYSFFRSWDMLANFSLIRTFERDNDFWLKSYYQCMVFVTWQYCCGYLYLETRALEGACMVLIFLILIVLLRHEAY